MDSHLWVVCTDRRALGGTCTLFPVPRMDRTKSGVSRPGRLYIRSHADGVSWCCFGKRVVPVCASESRNRSTPSRRARTHAEDKTERFQYVTPAQHTRRIHPPSPSATPAGPRPAHTEQTAPPAPPPPALPSRPACCRWSPRRARQAGFASGSARGKQRVVSILLPATTPKLATHAQQEITVAGPGHRTHRECADHDRQEAHRHWRGWSRSENVALVGHAR
jgi:hypothetical protein